MKYSDDFSTLEYYVKEYKIFIDTCSLLDVNCEKFWNNIIPLIKMYQNPVIITKSTAAELEKHSKAQKDQDLMLRATNAIKRINELLKDSVVQIFGDSNDGVFADNIFLSVFTRFRLKYSLLLITQDNNLAMDVIALNNSHSVTVANKIDAKRINSFGMLNDFGWHSIGSRNSGSTHATIGSSEKFNLVSKITDIPDTKINIAVIPQEGDEILKSDGSPLKLTKRLGGGGEADIYSTDTQYVAKIYKPDQMTMRKKAKIELMLTKSICCQGICYPTSMLYNKQNEFIGYLMPAAKGVELAKSVFMPQLLKKKFPDWTKKDTVQLSITILEKIKYLHDRNIIIGDINPSNILVVSPTEVYIVDTDSFQVEGFPCPVGTINFTAPEIQKKRFESFLRTKGNENFAVATLMFMIMLPGKPPYSQQGGEDPISNIIKMDFSYPAYGASNKKAPDGPWKFMWSHLTRQMKEDFYDTFATNGRFSKEEQRLSVDQWLDKFREYYRLLMTGKLGTQDKMSECIFPTRRKKDPNATYIICTLCGEEADEKYAINGICSECLKKGEVYKCAKCGCKMVYTNRRKLVEGKEKFTYCKDCHEQWKASFGSQPSASAWKQNSYSPRYRTSTTCIANSSHHSTSAMTSSSSAINPVQATPVGSQQQTAGNALKKCKAKNWSLGLTAVIAIISAILLFVNRWNIMDILFHNSSFLRKSGFVFDVVWPILFLFFPWAIACGILLVIFSSIETKIAHRNRQKKHRVLKTILVILLLIIIAAFVYDHFNPGFIQSIPVWMNATFYQITGIR